MIPLFDWVDVASILAWYIVPGCTSVAGKEHKGASTGMSWYHYGYSTTCEFCPDILHLLRAHLSFCEYFSITQRHLLYPEKIQRQLTTKESKLKLG